MSTGYRSGFCAAGHHERCRGDYRTAVCDCPHHDEPTAVTVHCFFRCEHLVIDPDSQTAHDLMEKHYFDAHRPDIAVAVGWLL